METSMGKTLYHVDFSYDGRRFQLVADASDFKPHAVLSSDDFELIKAQMGAGTIIEPIQRSVDMFPGDWRFAALRVCVFMYLRSLGYSNATTGFKALHRMLEPFDASSGGMPLNRCIRLRIFL